MAEDLKTLRREIRELKASRKRMADVMLKVAEMGGWSWDLDRKASLISETLKAEGLWPKGHVICV